MSSEGELLSGIYHQIWNLTTANFSGLKSVSKIPLRETAIAQGAGTTLRIPEGKGDFLGGRASDTVPDTVLGDGSLE